MSHVRLGLLVIVIFVSAEPTDLMVVDLKYSSFLTLLDVARLSILFERNIVLFNTKIRVMTIVFERRQFYVLAVRQEDKDSDTPFAG